MSEHLPTGGEDHPSPQHLLKRAYLLTSFGLYDEAIQCCERAAVLASHDEDLILSKTLMGSFFTASGRPSQAIKILLPLHRAHPQAALTGLHLAEACFFAGRPRRGWKILSSLSRDAIEDCGAAAFAATLEETWRALEGVPSREPLVVPS
jgi:tetratricopeptide (TPR) repeat protein